MTDPVHVTHGLAGDETTPDWPALTRGEVADVLDRYALDGPWHVVWRSPRPLSAAALATGSEGMSVFVKRHHASVRSATALAEEHRFALHLRGRGLPIPDVLAAMAGGTVTQLGDWVYEVHVAARGSDIYRDAFSWSPVGAAGHAFAAGAMLARLHLAAADYRAPQRSTHVLVARADVLSACDPLATLAAQLPARPALATYLGRRPWQQELHDVLAPWHPQVASRLAAEPRLWTHGDWHVSNLCWTGPADDAGVSDILDFGLAAQTFALFDLATAIERNAIAWLDIDRGDIARADLAAALIAGYDSVLPLDAAARSLLADLMPIVHVDFALSEVEYFEGVTHRRDHADVAWETFLRGHAAWFGTPPGRRFLDGIRYTH